jgi:hypothetical protein
MYNISAIVGCLLVLYVMQKTEFDRINTTAPLWLQWIRRGSFVIMAMLLLNSVLNDASQLSLKLLVWSGIGAVLINAVALALRTPPDIRSKRPTRSGFHPRSALRAFFVSLRNDLRK